jgi:cell division protein FtsZ
MNASPQPLSPPLSPPLSTLTAPPIEAPKQAIDIRIFGVGSAGINLLEQLIATGAPAAAFVAVHADATALAASSAADKIQLAFGGADLPALPVEEAAKFTALCQGTKAVFIVAGLGGQTGTAFSPILAKAAREAGALVLAFAIMPFDCEGNLRTQAAQDGLDQLSEAADLLIPLANEKALPLIGEATSLADTYKAPNELLGKSIRGVWQALTSQSIIGLPFTELCRLIRQRSSQCALAVAQATGLVTEAGPGGFDDGQPAPRSRPVRPWTCTVESCRICRSACARRTQGQSGWTGIMEAMSKSSSRRFP